jgi:hypothetical protein
LADVETGRSVHDGVLMLRVKGIGILIRWSQWRSWWGGYERLY